jgi:hypothetical protein
VPGFFITCLQHALRSRFAARRLPCHASPGMKLRGFTPHKASFGTTGQEFMQRAEHLQVITSRDNSISVSLFSGSASSLAFYNSGTVFFLRFFLHNHSSYFLS